jgi:hypothetical protein
MMDRKGIVANDGVLEKETKEREEKGMEGIYARKGVSVAAPAPLRQRSPSRKLHRKIGRNCSVNGEIKESVCMNLHHERYTSQQDPEPRRCS